MSEILELVDYRRQVAEIYRQVRHAQTPEAAWTKWRVDRDALFAGHPQSPIEDMSGFEGLLYFEYDPKWRTTGRFLTIDSGPGEVPMSSGGSTGFGKAGTVEFDLVGATKTLEVLWLDAYGGGLFIPFRDQTNGDTTYGGGRYLLDTVKGADLGQVEDRLILDFNFSYHPSCVHSPRWSCPLAPKGNHLDIAVTAGERLSAERESQ